MKFKKETSIKLCPIFIHYRIHFQHPCPPLWARQQHARLSRSRPGFDPRSGQVSWVRCFRGFSSPVRQMSGSFRLPRSPNIIWPSLSSIIIHYGHQWPEMLTCPKNVKYTYIQYSRVVKIHNRFWHLPIDSTGLEPVGCCILLRVLLVDCCRLALVTFHFYERAR